MNQLNNIKFKKRKYFCKYFFINIFHCYIMKKNLKVKKKDLPPESNFQNIMKKKETGKC